MSKEEDDETQSLLELYLRSRAREFSRFFNGLSGLLLEMVSTYNAKQWNSSRIISTLKSPKPVLILSITLVLSLTTGFSMMGFLRSETEASPTLDIEVHSGLWGSIPIHESTNQTFRVENTSEQPLVLELKPLNWNPIMAIKDIDVSWDYDGDPLLPGEATDVTVSLENVGLDGTFIVSLDIHVIGKIY